LHPEEKMNEEKLEHTVNIEEKINDIQTMLLSRIKFGFNQMLEQAKSKTEIIVSFLALLELVKQRFVTVDQGELFDEIFVMNNQNETIISETRIVVE
jgi:segregation and condensation protein A